MGRRASGTRATVTPMPKTNPSAGGVPTRSAAPNEAVPTPMAMREMVRTTRWSSVVRGERGRRPAWARRAIPASRVREPVAVTWPTPSPAMTNVPAKAVPSAPTGEGSLSPVNVDVSISRPWATRTLRSAEIRSPGARSTTSPTTSSAASISTGAPSRTTVARRGSRARSRRAAVSARCSWAKANRPFRTITTKIATPSWGSPARNARPPAPQSIRAKKWMSCARSRRRREGPRRSGRRLAPSLARRARASSQERPGWEPTRASPPGAVRRGVVGSTSPLLRPPRRTPERYLSHAT
ncbi:MAG: hypothetical protein KatS3mg013_0705 [Actinomycetota bacterium]|nr:MAG: hypothetical protein KatS3mg013_0705 [Actinomycetota bacterium]